MKRNNPLPLASLLFLHYPDACCSLNFNSPYECLVSVLLSAQCTDAKVNKVTPILFSRYPDILSLSKADAEDIEKVIKPLGLAKAKAKNLQKLASFLVENFKREIPRDYEALLSLPGVGNKTARVVLMEAFGVPSFPVDTHVGRISSRLGLVKEGLSPTQIEAVLERIFPKEEQRRLHHCFIAFGRDICKARSPECQRCFLNAQCAYFLKNKSFKTGR